MRLFQPLFLARLYYFLYFGAIGCYFPYVNLYFEKAGLSGTAIGGLAALGPMILLGAGPGWGALGDRFRIHRYLLPLATFGPVIPIMLMASFTRFEPLAVLVILSALFSTAIGALIDSAVLDLIAESGHSYGGIRVWGSIGFTAVTWVMGYVLNRAGLQWLFYSYGGLMTLAAAVALALPARRQTWHTSFRASLGELLRQRPLTLFLLGAFLGGAAFAAAFQFYPLQLQALGGNTEWMGWAGALGSLTEIPFLFYSQVVFRKLGVRRGLSMAFLIYAGRWVVMAFTRSPLVALLTQLTHGASFGVFLVGSVAFFDEHTPAGMGATAQSLLVAMTFGLGAAVGATAGGWLYEHIGATGMYLAAAMVTLAALGVTLLATQPSVARQTA